MKQIFGLCAGLLLLSIVGTAEEYTQCSDAYGNLRYDSDLKSDWTLNGLSYRHDDIKKGKLRNRTSLTGDKYNGHYSALAKFKASDAVKKLKRHVLCRKVDTEKSSGPPPEELDERFVHLSNILQTKHACSNASGTIQKTANSFNNTWIVNGTPTEVGAYAVYNSAKTFRGGDEFKIYEISIINPADEMKTVPELMICQ